LKVILFVISLFLVLSISACGNKIEEKKFDAEKWKIGSQIDRGNMSTDLVESKILVGKNKSDVLHLLGEPKDSSNTNFHYLVDLGYMTPFHLDVSFDLINKKVIEVTLAD